MASVGPGPRNPAASTGSPHLAVSGPYRVPAGPAAGPEATGYPASIQTDHIGPHLLLTAPRQLVRRQRPRAVAADFAIRIYFAPGGEEAARTFASRPEFVASGDPRCVPVN